jgi:hypothetical protein
MILSLFSCNKLNPSSIKSTSYNGAFVGVGLGVFVIVGVGVGVSVIDGVGVGVPVGGSVWFFGTKMNLPFICQDIP